MEGTFGALAIVGDAGEDCGLGLVEQRVGFRAEVGFQAIGSLYVPGCENQLIEEGEFNRVGGAELLTIAGFQFCEKLVILFSEEDG